MSAAGRLTIAAALAVSLVCPTAALAEDPAPPPGASWTVLEVGVLPVVSFVRAATDAFEPRQSVRTLDASVVAWQERLQTLLAARDLVDVVAPDEAVGVIGTLQTHQETLALADERFELGRQAFEALDLEAALRHLDRAARLYQDAWADLSHAERMAEVELHRGLALMERGDAAQAHVAFRRMWLLDPSRVFERGYYPAAVEEAVQAALGDLGTLPDLAAARYPDARRAGLAQRSGVDAWVQLALVGTTDRPVLQLVVWDSRTGAAAHEALVPLGAGDETAASLVERELAAWHTCAVTSDATSLLRERRPPAWYIDVDFTHVLMLRHARTREAFPGPGASVGVTWEATKFVHAWLQLAHTAMLPDANQDLVDTFVMSRFAVGAGVTGGWPDLRLYLRAGIETGVSFNDVLMTTDAECKHFGTDDVRCTRLETITAPGVWFGFVFGTGLRWVFTGDWYVHVQAELSSYVLLPELIGALNFPLSTSAGIGLRF